MTAALVQRPHRKMHLAGRRDGAWWSVCDRVVLDQADVVVTELQEAVGTIDSHAGDVCRDCHRLILMADVAHQLGVGRLVASLELTA